MNKKVVTIIVIILIVILVFYLYNKKYSTTAKAKQVEDAAVSGTGSQNVNQMSLSEAQAEVMKVWRARQMEVINSMLSTITIPKMAADLKTHAMGKLESLQNTIDQTKAGKEWIVSGTTTYLDSINLVV